MVLDDFVPALRCPRHPGAALRRDGAGLRCPEEGGHRAGTRREGIWDAMGGHPAPRSVAQLLNVLPPVTWGYEALWRVRSLSLLAHRPFPLAEELAALEEAVGDVRGGLVVDVACSEGLYGRRLAHAGARAVLVDHSRGFLRRAATRSRAEGIGAAVLPVRALAQHLPLGDRVADAAVMGGSLNEIGDADAAVAEMVRIVRPGGRLFLMSVLPSPSRVGRAAQRIMATGGIDFPGAAAVAALLAPGAEVVDQRVDGVVLRTTATRVGFGPR